MIKLTFRVSGLQSIYCAETLRTALNGIPGVTSYVSYKKAFAEVVAPEDMEIDVLLHTAEKDGYFLKPLTDENTDREFPP